MVHHIFTKEWYGLWYLYIFIEWSNDLRWTLIYVECVPKQESNLIFAHHQKCVIVDKNDKIIAFIGGLDLFSGRYDTPEHRLYNDKDTVFKGDFLNPTFKVRYFSL